MYVFWRIKGRVGGMIQCVAVDIYLYNVFGGDTALIIKTATCVDSRERTGWTQKRELGQKQTAQDACAAQPWCHTGGVLVVLSHCLWFSGMAPLVGLKRIATPP